jgi:uncharacterized protein (DUF362 family)
MTALVAPGERILLKPNFVTSLSADPSAWTHAEFIMAVARLVREAGAHPLIADSPAFGSAEAVAAKIGLTALAKQEGFPIRTLRGVQKKSVVLNGETHTLPVSAEALDADGIINLPKFKAHRQATFTFGTKNLYGCVAGKRKACRHFASGGDRDWFCNMLIANASILAPRFTLVDGIIGMEGQGPVRGTARKVNLVLGGPDVTAVDAVCCQVVSYPPLSLCTLKAARRLGYGVWDPDRIDVLGDPLESFILKDFLYAQEIPIFFTLPQLVRSVLRSWREMLAPE